jgi:hypothetical protein
VGAFGHDTALQYYLLLRWILFLAGGTCALVRARLAEKVNHFIGSGAHQPLVQDRRLVRIGSSQLFVRANSQSGLSGYSGRDGQ